MLRQLARGRGDLLGERKGGRGVGEMQNERIEKRPLLDLENAGQRHGVQSIAREAVDRFRRHADHFARAQQLHRARNRLGRGADDVIGLRRAGSARVSC